METNPTCTAVALWAEAFPDPVKPSEATYALGEHPELLEALDKLIPGFQQDPQPEKLRRWLALVNNAPVDTPRGRCLIRLVGHHWQVVVQDAAAAA
jgi:hypothetical protein